MPMPHRPLSQQDVENWLRPYPIAFRRRQALWDLRVRTLNQCLSLTCFWRVDGRRYSIGWWAKRVKDGTAPAEQSPVRSACVHLLPGLRSLTIMVVRDKVKPGVFQDVVVDGNHRLIALALARIHGFDRVRTGITHVGVLTRRG